MPPKFTPRLKRVASRVTGVKTPTKVATPSRRKKRADVLTPDRWRIVAAYLEISQGNDRLPRGGFNQLKQRFPTLKLNQRTVQKLVKQYKEQSGRGNSCLRRSTAQEIEVWRWWNEVFY